MSTRVSVQRHKSCTLTRVSRHGNPPPTGTPAAHVWFARVGDSEEESR
jgi:hypothetical protein